MQQIDLSRFCDASPVFSQEILNFQRVETASAVFEKVHASEKGGSLSAPTTKVGHVPADDGPIAGQLFSATAMAKVWTSRVAMHLDRAVRDRLFRQLDILHDPEEWVDDGAPVNLESFKCCVRAILYHCINSRPALSLMPSGNVLALWQDGLDKLTVEFLPGNQTRWMVQNTTKFGVERTASTAPLERLKDVLQPYGAVRWFSAA